MTTRADTEAILRRVIQFARLDASIRRHLTEEQAELVAAGSQALDQARGGSGVSDPTARAAHLLARYAHVRRRLDRSLADIDRALQHAQRVHDDALGGNQHDGDDIPLCPGWNAELRAQLGGCGKVLETYRLSSGTAVPRSTMLCISCRRAKERAERDDLSHD